MGRIGSSFMALAMSSLLLSAGALVPDVGDAGHAEAARQQRPQLSQRELRKYKGFEHSPLYERAHRLIYGDTQGRLGPEGRVRIAVIVNGDENIVVEDRVKNEIYAQLRYKFPRENFAVMKGNDVNTKLLQYAEDVYYDNRGTETYEASTEKQNEQKDAMIGGIGSSHFRRGVRHPAAGVAGGFFSSSKQKQTDSVRKEDRLDADGMPIGIRPRGIADLRREDFARAGQECGYDYVFLVTLSNGKESVNEHNFVLFNSYTNRKNVWLRIRFVDTRSGDYLYRNDIAMEGKTHNGFFNGRIMQRAVHKAMTEAMNDIDIN